MYTRSRQSQGNYPNARNQGNQGNQGQFNSPNYNQQQGNYQQSPTNQQQGGFKGGNAQNQPFNQQQKPQQQGNMQNSPARPMQQQMKPQMGQQQQQQQKMPQQQGNQTPQQPQRLKPILKQSTPSQQTPAQNQNQQQQQPPSQQQQQSQPQTQQQQQQQPQTQQQQANATANANANANTNAQGGITAQNAEIKNENQQENADVEMQDGTQPRWKRKVPGFKVNKKLKRLRMNQRLRKTLQPKNAIMVLNEMKAGVQFTFPENQGNMQNALYVVHAELDGKTYVGQGLSKPLARQNAAENALKALLLEKMTAASMKVRMDAESDGQSQTAESVKDENDENQSAMETTTDESEDIPWGSLASFAMYKLFLEWHNQGTSVPVPRPGLPPPAKAIKKDPTKPPVQKELPPNATSIHPVMLLNQMRPGLTYVELSRQGSPPNIMFTLAVEVDGVEYSGTAKNKKDAKKTAAKSALLALYNLSYPDDGKTEGSEDVQMS